MPNKNIKISDLIPDSKNANQHTERGVGMVQKSLQKYGAGRSILIDKNNKIIAGNLTAEQAASIGIDDVVVVETNGDKLVAVKRTDLDLNDKAAKELAIADNRSSEVSLNWDAVVLEELKIEGVELDDFFNSNELEEIGIGVKTSDGFTLAEGDKAPFQQMTFTLADEQALLIKNAISDIKKTDTYKYAETMGNENSNGNALYLIVSEWAQQKK